MNFVQLAAKGGKLDNSNLNLGYLMACNSLRFGIKADILGLDKPTQKCSDVGNCRSNLAEFFSLKMP